jgi:hypothetical protein
MVVKSTLYDTKNVTTPDEIVTQKFRSQGISIPIGIHHVIYVSKTVDFLDAFIKITTSAILVENEKEVVIIYFNFFNSEYVFCKNRYLCNTNTVRLQKSSFGG